MFPSSGGRPFLPPCDAVPSMAQELRVGRKNHMDVYNGMAEVYTRVVLSLLHLPD